MSASNWNICPRCMKKAIQENEKLQKQVEENYGKIPIDEYDKLHIEAQKDIALDQTLREDYEFYMADDGNFSASYRACCNQCDFSHEFNHNEKVTI